MLATALNSSWLQGASLGLGAIGTLSSAAGEQRQAEAEQAQANYQAQVSANNAIIANQNAEMATAAGNAQAENKGLASAEQIGAIRAAAAAGNVDVNTGTNALVQKSQREVANLDVNTIRSIAAQKAYGYKVAAEQASEQGQVYRAAAKEAPIAGDIAAGGTILGGAGSLAGKWATWQQYGSNPFDSGGGGGIAAPNEAPA